MSGGSPYAIEHNYANLTTGFPLVVDDEITWLSETSGNICPLNTFEDPNADDKDGACYTNPIKNLKIITSYAEEEDNWTISAAYSNFRSEYALENFIQFLDWRWIVEVDGSSTSREQKFE